MKPEPLRFGADAVVVFRVTRSISSGTQLFYDYKDNRSGRPQWMSVVPPETTTCSNTSCKLFLCTVENTRYSFVAPGSYITSTDVYSEILLNTRI